MAAVQTQAALQAEPPVTAAPPVYARLRWYAGLAAVAAVLVAVAWMGRSAMNPERQTAAAVQTLAQAVGTKRFTVGRLGEPFAWGPVPDVTRGGDAGAPVSLDVRESSVAVERLAERRRDAGTLHALGLARLAMGNIDESLSALQEAVALAPSNGALRADLSAALLEKWRRTDLPLDATRALSEAEIALQTAPADRAALFNRAIATEAIGLTDSAMNAWKDYLAVDATSSWGLEARAHLDRLRAARPSSGVPPRAPPPEAAELARIAAANPSALYRYLENDVLPDWAAETIAGRSTNLTAALSVAQALDAAGRDRELGQLVTMAEASARWPLHRRACLAQGLAALAAWRTHYEAARYELASGAAAELGRGFGCAGVSTASADLAQRLSAYTTRGAGVGEGADAAGARAAAARALRAAARLAQLQAITALERNRVADGLDRYQHARTLAVRAGDEEFLAQVDARIASVYELMGDSAQAWASLHQALARLPAVQDPLRIYNILIRASLSAAAAQLPGATFHFATRLQESTNAWENPVGRIMGRLDRAEALVAMDRRAQAIVEFDAGRALIQAMPASIAKDELVAELALTEGRIFARTDPARAITSITTGLTFLEARGNQFRTATLLLLRGRAFNTVGRSSEAVADWQRGLALIEAERAHLRTAELRVSRLDEMWDLFGELAVAGRANPEQALAVIERGHARELLDTLPDRADDGTLGPADLHGWLPDRTTALVYATLPDRLLIWTVHAGGVTLTERPVAAAELTARVSRALGTMSGPADDNRQQLARWLIPDGLDLSTLGTLVVVPDGALHRLPFAALPSPRAGHFLIEDHPVVVAPSLTVLRTLLGRRTQPRDGAALLVGSGIARADEHLPRLPAVDREIANLVRLYPRHLQVAPDAGWHDIRAALPRADVVHFAGHAISDPAFPARSRLLIGARGREEAITPGDLADVRLRPGALVVLAACETAQGQVFRGEGPLSLARPFLAAGAGAVVATLWRVSDDASASLLERFHQHVRDGLDPALALASSQRALIQDGVSPEVWGAFAVVGAAGRQ